MELLVFLMVAGGVAALITLWPGANTQPTSTNIATLAYLLFGGLAVGATSVLLPWFRMSAALVGTVSIAGIDRDGSVYALVLVGAAILAAVFFNSSEKLWAIRTAAILIGLDILLLVGEIAQFQNIIARTSERLSGNPFGNSFSASFDIGFYLSALGGLVALIPAGMLWNGGSENAHRMAPPISADRPVEELPPFRAPDPLPAQLARPIDDIERLAALHERGVLTDEEFAAKKKQVLGS